MNRDNGVNPSLNLIKTEKLKRTLVGTHPTI
jgi:hypothetical protein